MAKHHMPESHGSHPNVTPLIDVVMVLIVFFMLVAKIGVNTGEDTKLIKSIPKTLLGIEIKDQGNMLYLNVLPGQMDMPMVTALVPGRDGAAPEVAELKIRDAQNQNQLVNTLKLFRYGRDLKPKGDGINADNENFQVAIRANGDLSYFYIEQVLQACAMANVKAVNFKTAKKTEEVQVSMN